MSIISETLAPFRAAAVDAAKAAAGRLADSLIERLAARGFDINLTAPMPTGSISREAYRAALSRRHLFESVTSHVMPHGRRDMPCIVAADAERRARFIDQAGQDAGRSYDAFVAKMEGKIGACDSATIRGSHVWSYSLLTVTKGDVVEVWHTQQITNVSKLGTVFPQWPSRIMKGRSLAHAAQGLAA